MSHLTPKQSRFVLEYLVDLNATKAAVRAGYSPRTANEQASQLLGKPAVQAAIDAAKLERAERTKIDADWVLTRLADEADADLADLYDDKNNLLPIEDWPLIWRQGLVSGVEIEVLFEGKGDSRVEVGHVKKIRMSDRIRRLELIGKHVRVNAFQEVVEHRGFDTMADRLERAHRRLDATHTMNTTAEDAPTAPTVVAAPPLPPSTTAGERPPAATPAHPPPRQAEYRPILPRPPEKRVLASVDLKPPQSEPNTKGNTHG